MSIGSPYAGLEHGRWRSLIARVAVFHAARATLSEFCEQIEQGGSALLLLLDLERRARELLGGEDDVDDVEIVGRIVTAWAARLSEELELTQLDPDARKLLAALRPLVEHACATDPFQEIFAGIATKAREIYRDSWRPAALEMAHLGEPPRGGGDPYAATAATPWPPDDEMAQVELRIHGDGFRPAAFAAVPMLLAHECICHVPARQDRAANDSTFAEGLLDWAAYDLFEAWAVTLDSVLAPAARHHADLLRRVLTAAKSPEGRARRRGHRAADNLLAWFEAHDQAQLDEGHIPSRELAAIRVVKLATELNVIDRPLADKDAFVGLLGWPIPPELERALERWLDAEIATGALLDVQVA